MLASGVDTVGTVIGLVFLVLFVIGGVRHHQAERDQELRERYGDLTERGPSEPRR